MRKLITSATLLAIVAFFVFALSPVLVGQSQYHQAVAEASWVVNYTPDGGTDGDITDIYKKHGFDSLDWNDDPTMVDYLRAGYVSSFK